MLIRPLFSRCIFLLTLGLALAACKPATPVITAMLPPTFPTTHTTTATLTAPPTAMQALAPTRRLTSTRKPTATLHPTLTVQPSSTFDPNLTLLPTKTPKPTKTQQPPTTIPTYARSNGLPVAQEVCLHQEDYTIPIPEQSASAYRLKGSNETAALSLIVELDLLLPPCSESWSGPMGMNEMQNERRAVVKLALEEALARYPEIPEREEIEWRLALTNAWLETSTSDEWLVKAIEQALNDGRTTPETLQEFLGTRGFWIPNLEYYPDMSKWGWGSYVMWAWSDTEPNMLTMIPVPNLYSDGRAAQVFWVSTRYGGGGLFVALSQDAQNRYELRLIQSYWNLLAPNYDQFMVADHSQDGIPEILLPVGFRNGSRCQIKIFLYQWRNSHFENLMGNSLVFTNWCILEDALQFKKSPGQEFETISAMTDMGIDEYYEWNGQFYYLVHTELSSPYSKQPEPIYQQLVDGQYISATQQIEQALNELANNRIEPDLVSADYLRFQLGLSYALAGQINMARQTIQDLIDTTSAPQNSAIVQAANAFFDLYPLEATPAELYRACQTAADSVAKSVQPYRGEDGSVDEESLLQVLGYKNYYPLCDVDLVLPILARSMSADQQSDLPAALRAAGVIVEYSNYLDLDGDGDKDWLELINKPQGVDGNAFSAWVFLHDQQRGMTALKVSALEHGLPGPEVFEAQRFIQSIGESPITLLRSGSDLIGFQVFSGSFGSFISPIRKWSKITDFQISPGESVGEFQIWYTPDEYRPDWEIFGWHEGWQTFMSIQSKPSAIQIAQYGPIEAAQLADETLTVKWQPSEAIPLLQAALALPQGTDEGAWDCDWFNSYCVDRARLTYLLALAYELTGDETAAVQTYWQLWHDFPSSPYALMARAKLEPLKH